MPERLKKLAAGRGTHGHAPGDDMALFAGALSLTAITDLGAQISGISDASQYMLVAAAAFQLL